MLKSGKLQETPENQADTRRTFIIFRAADNLFGVNIENIREVMEPAHITRVPLASALVRGIINVRGEIIPAIDLCFRLYGSEMEQSDDSRVFIIEIKNGTDAVLIGGLVDSVVSVADIEDMELLPGPEFGSKMNPDFIKSAGKMHDRFIMLLDIDRVFDIDDLALNIFMEMSGDRNNDGGLLKNNEKTAGDILKKPDRDDPGQKAGYVLFTIGSEQYGIGIDRVLEVVRIEGIERLPNTMPFMKGVMNIRNTAVPLVDMRLRCGLPEKPYTADTAVLTVNTGGFMVGLVVDAVSAVMEFRADAIQNTLHYSAQIDRDFISGLAEDDNRFTVLVNADRILADDEVLNLKITLEGKNTAGPE